MQQALALVAASEVYSEVLRQEDEPRVEGQADEGGDDDQLQVVQAAAPSPVLKAAIIRPKDWHIEGEVHLIFLSRPHTVLMPLHLCV